MCVHSLVQELFSDVFHHVVHYPFVHADLRWDNLASFLFISFELWCFVFPFLSFYLGCAGRVWTTRRPNNAAHKMPIVQRYHVRFLATTSVSRYTVISLKRFGTRLPGYPNLYLRRSSALISSLLFIATQILGTLNTGKFRSNYR